VQEDGESSRSVVDFGEPRSEGGESREVLATRFARPMDSSLSYVLDLQEDPTAC
jgi:hypothetical protein